MTLFGTTGVSAGFRMVLATLFPSLAANSHFGLPTVRKDALRSAGGGGGGVLLTHLGCVSMCIIFSGSMILTLSVVDVAIAWRWNTQSGEVQIF